jgi:hypothetical protein
MRKTGMMLCLLGMIVCSSMAMKPLAHSGSMPKDGELAFPSDYKSWPTFLSGVQKPDAVRDLFVNPVGAKTQHGQLFPNGTILVMEIYHAKTDAAGNFEKGADGLLVKTDPAKVFVMQKEAGWGANAPANLKNGDWIFSAFKPNGDPLETDYTQCRSCHLPLGDAKDYVHRYDEYFEQRDHRSH